MAPQTYTLYHNKYSVCSIMVRYTLALRGTPKDPSSPILIEEKDVDIFHQEQLSEHYLCEINPKGQVSACPSPHSIKLINQTLLVPVLTSSSLDKPLPDSLDITHYLSNFYPSLIPEAHKERITKGLQDLHSLNYFSLSFPGRENVAQGFKDGVSKILTSGPISERYKDALEYKLGM